MTVLLQAPTTSRSETPLRAQSLPPALCLATGGSHSTDKTVPFLLLDTTDTKLLHVTEFSEDVVANEARQSY